MSSFSSTTSPTNPALLPLLSTTATLSLALYETIFFNVFLESSRSPAHRHSTAQSLSLWWRTSLPTTLPMFFSLLTASLISGIRTYRALTPLQTTKRYVALAGTLLAVGHLAFAPKIAGVIQDMAFAYERVGEWSAGSDRAVTKGQMEEKVADEAVFEGQRRWLRVHLWRTLMTDGPAWGCFAWLVFGRGE